MTDHFRTTRTRDHARIHAFARFAAAGCAVLLLAAPPAAAQNAPTATPVQINLTTLIPPTQTPLNVPTQTWTPPPTPSVQLQARDFANVRAEPDTSAAQLGVIRSGENYPVTGRYFSWYQLQFPSSPTGRAWVFGELVDILGDASAIPEFDPAAVATLPPLVAGATQTQLAITQTPGILLTSTVLARATPTPEGLIDGPMLPTFTYPPGIGAAPPTPGAGPLAEATAAPSDSPAPAEIGGFPPILAIGLLAGLGALGLLASAARR
jgi:hypothetical protein